MGSRQTGCRPSGNSPSFLGGDGVVFEIIDGTQERKLLECVFATIGDRPIKVISKGQDNDAIMCIGQGYNCRDSSGVAMGAMGGNRPSKIGT